MDKNSKRYSFTPHSKGGYTVTKLDSLQEVDMSKQEVKSVLQMITDKLAD